jgi:hypothetical protein
MILIFSGGPNPGLLGYKKKKQLEEAVTVQKYRKRKV